MQAQTLFDITNLCLSRQGGLYLYLNLGVLAGGAILYIYPEMSPEIGDNTVVCRMHKLRIAYPDRASENRAISGRIRLGQILTHAIYTKTNDVTDISAMNSYNIETK